MDELVVFTLSKKRSLIAMHEWLQRWKLPPVPPLQCPRCQSTQVSKRPYPKDGKSLCCRQCRQDFSLEELRECRCTYPGMLPDKCFDCQHYRAMIAYVERRKPELDELDEQQLDQIMASANFYQRDLTKRSPDSKQQSFDVSFNLKTLFELNEGEIIQLGLFNDEENY